MLAKRSQQLRSDLGQSRYGIDDLLDAIAALWSTMRYASREQAALPEQPEFDELDVRMQIIA